MLILVDHALFGLAFVTLIGLDDFPSLPLVSVGKKLLLLRSRERAYTRCWRLGGRWERPFAELSESSLGCCASTAALAMLRLILGVPFFRRFTLATRAASLFRAALGRSSRPSSTCPLRVYSSPDLRRELRNPAPSRNTTATVSWFALRASG